MHNKVSDVLSNMRRTIKVSGDISESIKEQAFQLLIKINNGESGDKIYGEVRDLNEDILEYISKNKIDIGKPYVVTKTKIKDSIDGYIKKNK